MRGSRRRAGAAGPPDRARERDEPRPERRVATATALLLALYHRARTGEGQAVETSMLCSNAWVLSADYVDFEGRAPREVADAGCTASARSIACMGPQRAGVFLARPTPRGFAKLCESLAAEELARDPRFRDAESRRRHDAELAEQLAARFAKRPAAEWEALLTARGIGCVRADRVPSRASPSRSSFMRESGFVTEVEDPSWALPALRPERDTSTTRSAARPVAPRRATRRVLGSWASRPNASTRSCARGAGEPGAGPSFAAQRLAKRGEPSERRMRPTPAAGRRETAVGPLGHKHAAKSWTAWVWQSAVSAEASLSISFGRALISFLKFELHCSGFPASLQTGPAAFESAPS
jgi:hypothetical protein